MQAASAEGRARHYLVIGPWDHPGTRTPKREFLGLKFGAASLVDLPQLHLDWYRYAMENGPKPDFLHKAVAYYVSGAERWRYADTLEAITATSRPFFLESAGGGAQSIYSAGSLAPARPGRGSPDRYRYDPSDTAMAKIESEADVDLMTGQPIATLANDGKLVYVSAPFEQDQEISGFFRLEAWISIDQPDTDFSVIVSEIDIAGNVTRLSADVMRARYRESSRSQRLVTTKNALRYDFDRFRFASRLVRKGSRLELIFSQPDPFAYEKNYNSGGVVADETRRDARPVTVAIFHDEKHPSALYVPFATAETAGRAR
jgi:putative CocE/NonD family hydrolase